MAKSTTHRSNQKGNVPPTQLKFYICTDHDYIVSRGRASYVVAANEVEAREMLSHALIKAGLQPYDKYRFNLREVDITEAMAEVLVVGDGV